MDIAKCQNSCAHYRQAVRLGISPSWSHGQSKSFDSDTQTRQRTKFKKANNTFSEDL